MTHTLEDLMRHPFIEVIKHYEGWYARPYLCPAGKWTIGYGHLCDKDHPTITLAQGDVYLKADLAEAYRGLQKYVPHLLQADQPTHRAVALLSWVFNLGAGNLASSTLLKRLRTEDWETSAKEMLRWNKATGPDGKKRTLAGLTRRRKSEAHCFLTGEVNLF